jgi:hypothetical protein
MTYVYKQVNMICQGRFFKLPDHVEAKMMTIHGVTTPPRHRPQI